MNYYTNQTSLRTKEPSQKLLRISLAAFNNPTGVPTEPSIINDSVLSIAEPTITDDWRPETTAEETTLNGILTVVDVDKPGFISKAWNHKLQYNDWKGFYFITTIILALMHRYSNSLPGDNHYTLDGRSGIVSSLINVAYVSISKAVSEAPGKDPKYYSDSRMAKRKEDSLYWSQLIQDLIFLVFPALVLSGYLTCPAIIMNVLLFGSVIFATIMTPLVSALGGTCGVLLTAAVIGYVCNLIRQKMTIILRHQFQDEVHFELPMYNPNDDPTMTTRQFDFKVSREWEQRSEVLHFDDVTGFYRGPRKCNIIVPNGARHNHGLYIDNSKGYAKSFILEIQKVLDAKSMQLHYVTKDSMIYSDLVVDRKETMESGILKVTIHGMKVTDGGIERRRLMDYEPMLGGGTGREIILKYEWYGVWAEMHKQLRNDDRTFEFIPAFKSIFAPHPPTMAP